MPFLSMITAVATDSRLTIYAALQDGAIAFKAQQQEGYLHDYSPMMKFSGSCTALCMDNQEGSARSCDVLGFVERFALVSFCVSLRIKLLYM